MKNNNGKRYTKEEKASIVKRMMPPNNETVGQLSNELGITEPTLYKWRKGARMAGNPTPGDGQSSEQWSSEDKFLVVMETFTMNSAQLAEYCRKKGLYKEQIEAWRVSCLNANGRESSQSKQLNQELKEEKKRARTLEKDLRKKEKALAEAAALLLLRKKAQAIWGDQEDE
ncbi:transposase [Metabacillus malikii]|uniref:Transposase-like protein n=1 Tax=Metabacillus malikii TaxID=1504265 RepID=A0ABT9ZJZ1_9BACI|nr:transposase [Metabacillus malikii]MDQ0232617.1 transposase-like protein [Metabacillus malikii]